LTESGTASILPVSSYSVKEGMTEDVIRDVTLWRGDFDCVAIHKLVNVNGVWTQMTSSSLPLKLYLVTEGVTECGAALGTRPRGNLCGIVLQKT